ncbi:hypothetical protein COCNU_16G005800 [Cocos nucifera]|uniref:Uncharacterized protein n=1 Tax=Cocos nucifera TaxID=13894 RepID=A0A8K0IYP2_COCNU|nr:hypothetical protein COCNU_16G005800 [Cocos nucifera]
MAGRIPEPLRMLGSAAALVAGGIFTLSVVSSVAIRSLQSIAEAKRRKVALPCMVCKGKGFYACKLCKGNSTIEWSPLYDPIVINPCLCPTCDGNRSGFSTLKTDLRTLRSYGVLLCLFLAMPTHDLQFVSGYSGV